jgi:hypothetical protein
LAGLALLGPLLTAWVGWLKGGHEPGLEWGGLVLGGLLGALLGPVAGGLWAGGGPVQARRYSWRRGTVELWFRRPEYAAAVLAPLTETVGQAGPREGGPGGTAEPWFRRPEVLAPLLLVVALLGAAGLAWRFVGRGEEKAPARFGLRDYDRIRGGMSESEVVGLLGEPDASERPGVNNRFLGLSGATIRQGTVRVWRDGEATIKVLFIGGRVRGKACQIGGDSRHEEGLSGRR